MDGSIVVCRLDGFSWMPRGRLEHNRCCTVNYLEDVLVGGAVLKVAADGGNGVVEGNGVLHLQALRGSHDVAELAET